MNKILNWTFGACFRTLGRFLAIFIVGLLLIFIGSKIGFKMPDWLALKVNASENIYANYWNDLKGLDGQLAPAVIGGYYGSTLNERDNYFFYETPKTNRVQQFEYIEIPFYTNFYSIVQNLDSSTNTSGSINIENGLQVYMLTTLNGILSSHICNIKENTGSYYIAKCPFVRDITNIRGFRVNLRTEALGSYLLPSINVGFARDVIMYMYNSSSNTIIQNQQQTNDKLDDMNQTQNEIKDSINNDDTTGAEDSASGFFNDFNTETFGLTSIITAPLITINSLLDASCSPLVLPIPFVNKNLTLPCMSSIYNEFFGGFFNLYQIITTGLISYYVIVRIFNLVKDFKNPEHDEIEVMDL